MEKKKFSIRKYTDLCVNSHHLIDSDGDRYSSENIHREFCVIKQRFALNESIRCIETNQTLHRD